MPKDDLKAMYAALGSISDKLADTERLRNTDYELIGRVIQLFCVIDLESRRVIGAMREIRDLPPIKVANLNDKDVPMHLKAVAEDWEGTEVVREKVLMASAFVSTHEHIRHSLAHWAGRRIRGHEALYFVSTRLNHKTPDSWHEVPSTDPQSDAGFRLLLVGHLKVLLKQGEPLAQLLGNLAPSLEMAITAKASGLSS